MGTGKYGYGTVHALERIFCSTTTFRRPNKLDSYYSNIALIFMLHETLVSMPTQLINRLASLKGAIGGETI